MVVGGGGGCNESNVDDGSLTYLCASLMMMMNREMLPSINMLRRVERERGSACTYTREITACPFP